MKRRILAYAVALGGISFAPVHAIEPVLNIGVILSTTGPGASLGKPAEKTVALWPERIGGIKTRVTLLNDDTDPTTAARNASRLIINDSVDVIVGPSLTPSSIAILDTVAQHRTPLISLAGGGDIVAPMNGTRKWAFKMSPPEAIAVRKVLAHMQANQQTRLGAAAITTSYGDGFLKALTEAAPHYGVQLTGVERYNQTDPSFTAQALKLIAGKPDAIYIFSAGTPGALPQLELAARNYRGQIYQTQGVANADFLRVGGKILEGTLLTAGPVLVAEQLPDTHSSKATAVDYVNRYEAAHGPGSRSLFGASAWTAMLWLDHAVPQALAHAQPGTPAFRSALRDALETMQGVTTPEGSYSMSADDHNGAGDDTQVLVRIGHNAWRLAE
ncbi:ABC transporter substrate-binding protein [Kerstersia sp.]|uniref:ABC transporter substrate-binding protein n=1 Tax=Kerstersia sp. TaxID=1930783 RepID=UPI003F93ECBC